MYNHGKILPNEVILVETSDGPHRKCPDQKVLAVRMPSAKSVNFAEGRGPTSKII